MVYTPIKGYPNFGTHLVVPPIAFPATIAADTTWNSDLIPSAFGGVSFTAQSDTSGVVITIQRYADLAGNCPVGSAWTATLDGTDVGWCGGVDGVPYLSFNCSITNSGGTTVNMSNMQILTGSSLTQ